MAKQQATKPYENCTRSAMFFNLARRWIKSKDNSISLPNKTEVVQAAKLVW
jgi:hypothetical protein